MIVNKITNDGAPKRRSSITSWRHPWHWLVSLNTDELMIGWNNRRRTSFGFASRKCANLLVRWKDYCATTPLINQTWSTISTEEVFFNEDHRSGNAILTWIWLAVLWLCLSCCCQADDHAIPLFWSEISCYLLVVLICYGTANVSRKFPKTIYSIRRHMRTTNALVKQTKFTSVCQNFSIFKVVDQLKNDTHRTLGCFCL